MSPAGASAGVAFNHAADGGPAAEYRSALVERVKAQGFSLSCGRLTIHLAREFGFCYGVDRAVEYAYRARRRFPDRVIYLAGEIIHNPYVNERLRSLGIRFLDQTDEGLDALSAADVVILPAFGVPVQTRARLEATGCTVVDTTCGSVLNVWKSVRRYAREGFTAIIHGKVRHEETQATASQAQQVPGGRFLIVLDEAESAIVCDYIRHGGRAADFLARFGHACSPGFDPDVDLQRIGLANQTTMLMSESLAIADLFRTALLERYGAAEIDCRFRALETICSATEDRQNAVRALLDAQPLDLMLVIGGHNSSNTRNLARLCAARVPTFHVADAEALVSQQTIRHWPVGQTDEVVTHGWLPAKGPVAIGLTAGASTPDVMVGLVIERLQQLGTSINEAGKQ